MAGRKAVDMTGERYGRLTVIKRSRRKMEKGDALWVCRCNCGAVVTVRRWNLVRMELPTVSCGCWREQVRRRPVAERRSYAATYPKARRVRK